MSEVDTTHAENFDVLSMFRSTESLQVSERAQFLAACKEHVIAQKEYFLARQVVSPAGREVQVQDLYSGQRRPFLMFGSNNYLGFACHPYVQEKVLEAVRLHGVGVGGPPMLNGNTALFRSLEERLAALKGKEDAVLFSSGYGANVGLLGALLGKQDILLYDAFSHASFLDGIRLAGRGDARPFRHNDLAHLAELLAETTGRPHRDLYVGVEGVYSMDGDLAPLDAVAALCRAHAALLILDDAHGTGILGARGGGSAEHFGVESEVDLLMGTFSKVFAVTGGFVATSQPIADLLRVFARSFMFSASLPPVVLAAVHAGLDLLEREPERRTELLDNVRYFVEGLRTLGIDVRPDAAIVALLVKPPRDIRKVAFAFHERGLFVNAIEYPAVPLDGQRLRISLMCEHTRADLDRLLEAIREVLVADS